MIMHQPDRNDPGSRTIAYPVTQANLESDCTNSRDTREIPGTPEGTGYPGESGQGWTFGCSGYRSIRQLEEPSRE